MSGPAEPRELRIRLSWPGVSVTVVPVGAHRAEVYRLLDRTSRTERARAGPSGVDSNVLSRWPTEASDSLLTAWALRSALRSWPLLPIRQGELS